ncbi:MAG: hypothetical protein HC837_10755 [Chloroflexaceae bacterium]|nr:hypothetical protein [Chloroflexaceae bacterium]
MKHKGSLVTRALLLFLALGSLVFVMPISTTQAQNQVSNATLGITPGRVTQNNTITMFLNGFFPNESVTVWQTFPDLSVEMITDVSVDGAGNNDLSLFLDASLPTGRHYFSARGNFSGFVAIGFVDLLPRDAAIASRVSVEIAFVDGDIVVFGSGFEPRETVSMWVNMPDESVRNFGRSRTDKMGDLEYERKLDPQYGPGLYTLVAQGNTSGLTGLAVFELVER